MAPSRHHSEVAWCFSSILAGASPLLVKLDDLGGRFHASEVEVDHDLISFSLP
jgi:hypothetical protein